MTKAKLTPHLIVRSTAEAIPFYETAFGARERERYTMPEGHVVHASIEVDGAVITLSDEAPDWHNNSPTGLGGSPVILTLQCDDPDTVCERAVAAGAEVVFPIDDQFYGRREGRIRDPFGHMWVLMKIVHEMTPEEIQKRIDDFHQS